MKSPLSMIAFWLLIVNVLVPSKPKPMAMAMPGDWLTVDLLLASSNRDTLVH